MFTLTFVQALTDVWNFILRYWMYLTLVGGILIVLAIVAAILNAHNRVPEEEPKVPEPIVPEPRKPDLEPLPAPSPEPIKNEAYLLPSAPSPRPDLSSDPKNANQESRPEDPQGGSEETRTGLLDNPGISADNPPKPDVPAVKPAPKPKNLGKYHVMYRADGKWYVKREGTPTILRVLETQREAISWATIKALTQDVGLIVHQKDGKIRKTDSK